jgi:hypothetical protein
VRQENIFVSYRRQTDSGVAGRIYDNLSRALPGVSIFMDVSKLTPGDNFEDALRKSLDTCKILLAIIGPEWTTMVDQSGRRRLDSTDDLLRMEVSTALAKGLRVIPVLIGGAEMPDIAVLPEELKPLARRQALEIRHTRFSADVDALAQAIAASMPGARGSRWRAPALAAVAILVIAFAGGVAYLKSGINGQNSPSAGKSEGPVWTAWFDQEGYQREFDREVANHFYPSMIEAQVRDGAVRYRASYEPFPSNNFEFWARHSIDDAEFASFDAELTKAGFTRIFQQRIMVGGRAFNQATWTKR